MTNKERNYILDVLRGGSALLVCANHLRAATFVKYSSLSDSDLADKFFYFITGLGHQSVMVFFVLSGFFIAKNILEVNKKFSFFEYIRSRAIRLWVVLIPALLLTAVIDVLIKNYWSGFFEGKMFFEWSSGPKYAINENLYITFFGNIFFLQGVVVEIFGSNSPLWSLSWEWWYYMIFPVSLIVVGIIKKTLLERSLCFLFLVGVIILANKFFLIGYFIWLGGAMSYVISNSAADFLGKKRKYIIPLSLTAIIFFVVFGKISKIEHESFGLIDLFLGFSISLFLLSVNNINNNFKIEALRKIAIFGSAISYSLYVVHFPIIVLITLYFNLSGALKPNLNGYIIYNFLLATLVFSGYVFWRLFESNTNKLKKYLIK